MSLTLALNIKVTQGHLKVSHLKVKDIQGHFKVKLNRQAHFKVKVRQGHFKFNIKVRQGRFKVKVTKIKWRELRKQGLHSTYLQ